MVLLDIQVANESFQLTYRSQFLFFVDLGGVNELIFMATTEDGEQKTASCLMDTFKMNDGSFFVARGGLSCAVDE